MSKVKSSEIPHYELLYIVSNKYTEEEIKPICANVNALVEKYNGTVTYSEDWGKKKLAYPIKHFSHGYYFLFEFDMESRNVNGLNNELRLSSELLRHVIVAIKKRSLEEIKAEKIKAEKIFKDAFGQKKAVVREEKTEEAPVRMEKIVNDEIVSRKKDIDLQDLDEKLDKILETDDLL
jgi:small subunit ribosomal protein S6